MSPETHRNLGWAIFVGVPPLSAAIARHFCLLIADSTPRSLTLLYGTIAAAFGLIGLFFLTACCSALCKFMDHWWKQVIDPAVKPKSRNRRRR
jgi:hypothetical protein